MTISARALGDCDTILPTPEELTAAGCDTQNQTSVRFVIWKDKAAGYRWKLSGADGQTFAIAPDAFSSKQQALAAVRAFIEALGKVNQLAA